MLPEPWFVGPSRLGDSFVKRLAVDVTEADWLSSPSLLQWGRPTRVGEQCSNRPSMRPKQVGVPAVVPRNRSVFGASRLGHPFIKTHAAVMTNMQQRSANRQPLFREIFNWL